MTALMMKRQKAGTDQPHFTFIVKPGLNVEIQNLENLVEFFYLFTTPKTAKLAGR